MRIHSKAYRIDADASFDLDDFPTKIDPLYGSEAEYKNVLEKHAKRLSEQQELHYASGQSALLVIFQAMDAAGKDGAIRHVMSGINPQGCQVVSFKSPTPAELAHDFLWRCVRELPARGHIGIFNRSYYEEVLIVRVHADKLAGETPGDDHQGHATWKERFKSINNLEKHLDANGTRIVKIHLHLSKDEQARRLIARIDQPRKNWKISNADMRERAFWKPYMKAYAACLSATSTSEAPWYVVPADDKRDARLIVSQILLDAFADMKISYPNASPEREKELQSTRAALSAQLHPDT